MFSSEAILESRFSTKKSTSRERLIHRSKPRSVQQHYGSKCLVRTDCSAVSRRCIHSPQCMIVCSMLPINAFLSLQCVKVTFGICEPKLEYLSCSSVTLRLVKAKRRTHSSRRLRYHPLPGDKEHDLRRTARAHNIRRYFKPE